MSSDIDAAVDIMAEATSHFVQDPYATEALEALLAAGWKLTPPNEADWPLAGFDLAGPCASTDPTHALDHETIESLLAEIESLRSLKGAQEILLLALTDFVEREGDAAEDFEAEGHADEADILRRRAEDARRLASDIGKLKAASPEFVSTCDCPPPYAECSHPPAPGPAVPVEVAERAAAEVDALLAAGYDLRDIAEEMAAQVSVLSQRIGGIEELLSWCPVHGGIVVWEDGIAECDESDGERPCAPEPLYRFVPKPASPDSWPQP